MASPTTSRNSRDTRLIYGDPAPLGPGFQRRSVCRVCVSTARMNRSVFRGRPLRLAEAGLLQPVPPLGNLGRAARRHGSREPHRVTPASSFTSSLPQDLSMVSSDFRSDPLRCRVLDPEPSEPPERSDDRSREVRRSCSASQVGGEAASVPHKTVVTASWTRCPASTSPRCPKSIAPERIRAIGLATPCSAMSGAAPCEASKNDTCSPMFAPGANPRLPATPPRTDRRGCHRTGWAGPIR